MDMGGRACATVTFGILCLVFSVSFAQRRPPSMTFHPPEKDYFSSHSDVKEYVCKATGSAPIKYEWQLKSLIHPERGFQLVTAEDKVRSINKGTLKLLLPTHNDAGHYRCTAGNTYGKAMSNEFQLLESVGNPFPTAPALTESAYVGEEKVIECRGKPKSVPPAIFSWSIDQNVMDASKRYITDQEGRFHIIVVEQSDEQLAVPYKCNQYNSIRKTRNYGSFTHLNVRDAGGNKLRDPSITYKSADVEVLVGQNSSFTLMCIPGGNPIPDIKWSRNGEKLKDLDEYRGRRTFEPQYERTVTISNVRETDQGIYSCYTHNNIKKDIYVKVVSKPIPIHKPESDVVLKDSTKTFVCEGRTANNHGNVKIEWYHNAAVFDAGLYPKVTLDNTRLTVTRAAIPDNIMSLACKMSNNYGSQLYGFTLNVIKPTVIKEERVEIYKAGKKEPEVMKMGKTIIIEAPVMIRMKLLAEADRLKENDLTYTWYRNDDEIKSEDQNSPVYIDKIVNTVVLNSNKSKDKDDPLKEIYGNYSCVVNVGVKGANKVRLMSFIPKEIRVPVINAAEFPFWIIGLVLGVIALILVIILIICVMYRNRGGIWKVDEKEREAGNNIEKELADSGFHDLGRADGPDDEKKPMDQRSLSDDEPPPGEDTASLDEYGEPDMSKFNEEGSFIDMYGKSRKPQQQRAEDPNYSPPADQQQFHNSVTPPPRYSQFPEYPPNSTNDTMV